MKGEKFLEKGNKIENQRLFEAKTNKRWCELHRQMNEWRTMDEQKTNNERRKDERWTKNERRMNEKWTKKRRTMNEERTNDERRKNER